MGIFKRLNSAFEEVKTEQNYSNKERVDIILLTLLNEDDYIKTQALAIDLNTSSQTIRNDYPKSMIYCNPCFNM